MRDGQRFKTMTKDLSYTLLGTRVDALTIPELNALVAETIERGEERIIANHNLHSIYLYHHDPKMRAFYARASYTPLDGMALVYLGLVLGLPLARKHRITYVDWLDPLMAEAARRGWRVFYLGSRPGVAERGAAMLREKFSGLQIATAHGYFGVYPGDRENQNVLEAINAYQPNILMVGMGMPRQEHWVVDNLGQFHANVVLNAGAAMDYVVGVVPTPPRWSGRLGLEWLFRLAAEPRRLWRRYLIEPWFVLGLFFAELRKRSCPTTKRGPVEPKL
jgi:N-acetylglucosaminyldiphosphoundecaprenol N-acetyl-beta-D-mannosaminyltransferase